MQRNRIACGAALVLWLVWGGLRAPPALGAGGPPDAAGPPGRAGGPPGMRGTCNKGDRALVTFTGRVTEVVVSKDGGDTPWVAAVLEVEGATRPVRVRIAPQPVLEAAGFRVTVGHHLQVRAFSAGATYDVQRLRDRDTGRVLRLRSLRGEPLWHAGGGHHHGGYGPGPHHGQHDADRGHGPGR